MRLRLCRTPRENPQKTIQRYAVAIDDHLDEATASEAQKTQLRVLIAAVQAACDAQKNGRPKAIINMKVGVAMGLCEDYIRIYQVPVPDAPTD